MFRPPPPLGMAADISRGGGVRGGPAVRDIDVAPIEPPQAFPSTANVDLQALRERARRLTTEVSRIIRELQQLQTAITAHQKTLAR